MGDQIRSQIGSGGPDPLADLVRGGGTKSVGGPNPLLYRFDVFLVRL